MNVLLLLSFFGIANLFTAFADNKRFILPLVMVVLAVVFGLNALDWNGPMVGWMPGVEQYLGGMLQMDRFAVGFTGIMVFTTLVLLPFSATYVQRQDANLSEYYSLLLFALVGAVMLVGYENLLMLFLGVEILSIPMYVLAGIEKQNPRSNEAALKYFLMGAFATGILLFGMALLYGATGTFTLSGIAAAAQNTSSPGAMLLLGLLMVLAGLAFKVGAAPFHFWTPDVYEGSPTFFTAFMSTVVKTAGFAAFYKLLIAAFAPSYAAWLPTVLGITVLTLLVGNLGAVAQTSTKRMLAYSSISHAGYLLIALVAFDAARSPQALFFYSLSYSIATVAAFAVVKLVADARDGREDYGALRGLSRTNPLLAVALAVSMLSLAGIPLTGGFFGKFFLFAAAAERGFVGLIVLAVLMAAVGIYYYFRPVIAAFISGSVEEDGDLPPVPVTTGETVMLWILTGLTLVLGILPGLVSGLLAG